jgi:anti-sigma B factor antagonist
MGVAHHDVMARWSERVERSSGAAPPPQPGGSDQPEPTLLTVRIQDDGADLSIVTLAGELDLSTIPRMEGPLLEQIRQRPAVLVDLSELEFIDSSGIGVLIQAFRLANGTPVKVLIGAGSQIERVFGIAGVTEALPVYSDREQALAALAQGRTGSSANPSD